MHVLFIQYVTPDDVFPLRMLPFPLFIILLFMEKMKNPLRGRSSSSDVISSIIPTRRRKSISQKPREKKVIITGELDSVFSTPMRLSYFPSLFLRWEKGGIVNETRGDLFCLRNAIQRKISPLCCFPRGISICLISAGFSLQCICVQRPCNPTM